MLSFRMVLYYGRHNRKIVHLIIPVQLNQLLKHTNCVQNYPFYITWQEISSSPKGFRPALGPNQLPFEWVLRYLQGVKRSGLTTYLHLVRTLRMSGATRIIPYVFLASTETTLSFHLISQEFRKGFAPLEYPHTFLNSVSVFKI